MANLRVPVLHYLYCKIRQQRINMTPYVHCERSKNAPSDVSYYKGARYTSTQNGLDSKERPNHVRVERNGSRIYVAIGTQKGNITYY